MKDDLEEILTFSVGIGNSRAEAEIALKKAKENKTNPFSIVNYVGEPINEEYTTDPRTKAYITLRNQLLESGDTEGLENLKSLVIDHRTGLNNLIGYNAQLSEQPEQKRTILFLDGNNMKYFNSKYGYTHTDQLLETTGKTITNNIREKDLLACRLHGSGDEYLISLPKCNQKTAYDIAHRLLNTIYKAQKTLDNQQ
jgi:GGDEF domain-containing protein